jgi:hypothetical protein
MNTSNENTGKVFSLTEFRQKKSQDSDIARGRKPLYLSHLDGKVTGSPHLKGPEAQDFGDRLQRIRHSLEKINSLMTELKRMSREKELEKGTK